MIRILTLHISLIAAYLVMQTIPGIEHFAALRWVRSFIELNSILTLPGLTVAVLIQYYLRKHFQFWEFLSTAAAAALTVVPFLFFLETTYLRSAPWWLAIANSALIAAVALILSLINKQRYSACAAFPKPQLSGIDSPLWIIAVLYLVLTAIITLAYFSLLELDPYYWLNLTQQFATTSLLPDASGRPLFILLTYLIHKSAHTDLYATFKYILPFFSALYLIPAWMVARVFSSRWQQLTILLLPLFSPSTILYQQTPFPQQIFIVLSWYFVYFLAYSALTKQIPFYFMAGIIILIGIYVHELFLFVLLIWLGFTLWHYRSGLFRSFRQQPIILLLLSLLLISNLNLIRPITTLLFYWAQRLFVMLSSARPNIFFPAQYINIDNNAMGWPGISGVIKFYAFYAGPPLILLLVTSAVLLIKRPSLKHHLATKEWRILIVTFLFFFTIAEVLPRALNIAILPDRAWIMISIFSAPWLFLFLPNITSRTRHLPAVLILLTAVSIGGAIFVNNQKKFVTTQSQLAAADWITRNLPAQRIFLTSGQRNLLSYHAHSKVAMIPAQYYCDDILLTDEKLSALFVQSAPLPRTRPFAVNQFVLELSSYITSSPDISLETIMKISDQNIANINSLQVNNIDHLKPSLFLFYYQDNEHNPFNERPYVQATQNKTCPRHIMDSHPERFQKLYDDGGEVEIWKII